MTETDKRILRWWRSFRPVVWTELDHIENPTINMCSGRFGEKALGKLAANIAKKLKKNQK